MRSSLVFFPAHQGNSIDESACLGLCFLVLYTYKLVCEREKERESSGADAHGREAARDVYILRGLDSSKYNTHN